MARNFLKGSHRMGTSGFFLNLRASLFNNIKYISNEPNNGRIHLPGEYL